MSVSSSIFIWMTTERREINPVLVKYHGKRESEGMVSTGYSCRYGCTEPSNPIPVTTGIILPATSMVFQRSGNRSGPVWNPSIPSRFRNQIYSHHYKLYTIQCYPALLLLKVSYHLSCLSIHSTIYRYTQVHYPFRPSQTSFTSQRTHN